MSRATRKSILLDGGYYHVFTRGNNRRLLFHTDGDRRFFIETVQKYQQELAVGVVHYCLMPNHVHFMLKAELAADLPVFMKKVLQVYACYFRQRYDSVGYVFQNRYKAILIKDQIHLLECGRYIERNPLRAKLIDNLSMYLWSSYRMYGLGNYDQTIKYINPLYVYLDTDRQKRMEFYRNLFAEERLYEMIVDKEFAIN
jgi:putative transposase